MRRGGQLLPARRKRQSFKSSRMPSMTDMPETFETFLRIWIAENISSLGDHTDPSDWKFIVRRKSDELTEGPQSVGSTANSSRPRNLTVALWAMCGTNLRRPVATFDQLGNPCCPLLALSGHPGISDQSPLLG